MSSRPEMNTKITQSYSSEFQWKGADMWTPGRIAIDIYVGLIEIEMVVDGNLNPCFYLRLI